MLKKIKKIFEFEASTGILITIATIIALFVVNSDNFIAYNNFFSISLPLNFDYIGIYKDLTLHNWINDGLMAIFFLLVSLELKEEILIGELSNKSQKILPLIGASGGIISPALISQIK